MVSVNELKYLESSEVQHLCECLEQEASRAGLLTPEIYVSCLRETCRKNVEYLIKLSSCTCEELLDLIKNIQHGELCTSLHHYLVFLHAKCLKIPKEDLNILTLLLTDVEKGMRVLFNKIRTDLPQANSPEVAMRIGAYITLLSIAQLLTKCREVGGNCEAILRGLEWRIRTLINAHSQDRQEQG